MTLGNVVYPRLVGLFYANLELKSTPDSVSFESIVKNVKITLAPSVLETIFGLKFINNAPSNLTRKLAKESCLSQFACPQKLATYTRLHKAPPYHVLLPKPWLLHYVFVRIFYRKDRSKEASNVIVLERFIAL